MYDLAGDGKTRVCTEKDLFPDGREFVRVGISPNIFVQYTLADYLTGNDPVLQKALDLLQSK